jgi:hypothetical protein
MNIVKSIIDVPEANDMPFIRWEAYIIAKALSKGLKGRFSIGVLNGMSRIIEYEQKTTGNKKT